MGRLRDCTARVEASPMQLICKQPGMSSGPSHSLQLSGAAVAESISRAPLGL